MKGPLKAESCHSFSIPYHGGNIWIEHLDHFGRNSDFLLKRFRQDLLEIGRPSTSAFIAVNVSQTKLELPVMSTILNELIALKKPLQRVAFIGTSFSGRFFIRKRNRGLAFPIRCFNDFEDAKNWLLP